MASFTLPIIQDNTEGWGPRQLPEKFKNMPYQPFCKGDRLGKVSDWSGATYNQDRRYANKYHSQFGGGSQYAYYHDEDESSFQLVDNTKMTKPPYQRNRIKFTQFKQRQQRQQQRDGGGPNSNQKPLTKLEKSRERDRQRLQRKMQKQYGQSRLRYDRNWHNQTKRRDASVTVKEDWEVLEEMDFIRLGKLKLSDVKCLGDLYVCGVLEHYDKTYDRVSVKAEKPLKRVNRIFHKVTTTDDPVIRNLAKFHGTVYATDTILATLMCCTRSQYSWDIIAQRVGRNKLFFDKRDDSQFDLLTVSETANESPQEENSINSPRNLSLEATFINHNFSQQVLKSSEKYKFDRNNPFIQQSDNVASVAYRYRKWDLGNNIELVARTEHDAVTLTPGGETCFINVKAMNEWDSRHCNGVDWRRKLDSQRGAVLATELKNNSCKLAKWTMSAILAGSEYLKLGYVSRANVRDTANHAIIGTQQFIPSEFAAQINLSLPNAWGILRCIIDTCMKMPEGKYLILKDPNKQVVRIYQLPEGTFSSDEEAESDDESSEEEEEK